MKKVGTCSLFSFYSYPNYLLNKKFVRSGFSGETSFLLYFISVAIIVVSVMRGEQTAVRQSNFASEKKK